ncbi:MAG: VanZ family protein [Pseudomonadota bacterium]|nr:VanZ family protein [Pseudomonadota bacterium]
MLMVVAYLSLVDLSSTPAPSWNDKLIHFSVYAVLGGWFACISSGNRLMSIAATIALYGAALELAQAFTPHRSLELGDMMANALGGLLGVLLYFTPLRHALVTLDGVLARQLR